MNCDIVKPLRSIGALLVGLSLAVTVSACSGPAASTTRRTPPHNAQALPPPLTKGSPESVTSSSTPNGRSRQEWLRLLILRNRRYASIGETVKALDFGARLPSYTDGAKLRYIITEGGVPGDPRGSVLWLLYSGDKLTVAENRQTFPGELGNTNGSVRGFPARVTRSSWMPGRVGKGEFADLEWLEQGVVYHIWYRGSTPEALRIAESIPKQ